MTMQTDIQAVMTASKFGKNSVSAFIFYKVVSRPAAT